jgi:hypothetical protein
MTSVLNRSQYAKRLSNLLYFAAVIAVMAAISFAAIWLIEQLQSLRCPAGTFLVGAGDLAIMLQKIPIVFASFGFGILTVEWLVHSTQRLQRFQRDLMRFSMREDYELRYRTFQGDLLRFSLIVLSIMLPISVVASLWQYCLLQQEILYQPWPWTGLQQYSWSDVATIETTCSRGGRGGWKGFFDVVMRDGARLEIPVPPFWSVGSPPFVRVYPEIARALDGVDFTFNSKNVSPGCPYASGLLRRP